MFRCTYLLLVLHARTPLNRNTVQLGHHRFLGSSIRLGPVAVAGSLDVPPGVLPFDDARV